MLYRLTAFTLLAAAALLSPTASARAAGDDAPAWLRQAAESAPPPYDKKVKAVVLLRDQSVTVSPDGHTVTTTNYAVRILAREGREEAQAFEPYQIGRASCRERV